jgi:hypothetical protein
MAMIVKRKFGNLRPAEQGKPTELKPRKPTISKLG